MKNTKTKLLKSALALLLTVAMLVGSTFAWFTDSVTSKGNVIQSGSLDIEMYWTDDVNSGDWHNVEDAAYNTIFNYNNWEPGSTDVKYIKLVNNGDLALNYKLAVTAQSSVGKLAEVINVYYAEGAVALQNREDLSQLNAIGLLSNVMNGGSSVSGTILAADQQSPLHPSGEVILTVAMNMITTANNDYQNETSGKFTVTAVATQAAFEKDSFGSNYDTDAEFLEILVKDDASALVTPVDGKVPAGGVTLQGDTVSAFVPEGVKMESGANKLTLTVTPMKDTTSNITVVNNEILIPVDVHIAGVAEDNTVPAVINLGEILPKYLNMGNYRLFHVENGQNSAMTLVDSAAELTAHNSFTYDPMTGAVSVAMASFSEVALLADTANVWNGNIADEFGGGSGTEADPYLIGTADQLAYLGECISNKNDTYGDKHYKLLADLDLGGEKQLFYPIGYHKLGDGANKAGEVTWYTYGGSFKGIFDGNGHTISNIYQNTWSMDGDYDNGYWDAAMGLFGYVYGGTIKNLTVDNFSSDGEFTPTGVIAAYAAEATFENIAITNCNPRVYNTGNGGIVGVGGNTADTKEKKMTFTNITVDNTNKISALWGSWDVACGGLMGMFRGYSEVTFTNCHVGAQIDVYNDVCGNYQYYWYRYAGMIIGSLRGRNTTDEQGYTVPDMTGITAKNCTVHFGDWNDYWYCELVANSLASYTHDHQFSRLDQIQSVSEIQDENNNWNRTGNFILMEGKTPTKICYHIRKDADGKFYEHTHESEGTEVVGGETVLKENNQRIYLPFNQLFQGDGWGVKHVPIYDDGNIYYDGISILDRDVANSVEKFATKFTGDFLYRVGNQGTVPVGTLFEAKDGATINGTGVWVTVQKISDDMNVSGTFSKNTEDWTKGSIQFSGTGVVKVTIQDYNYCKPTVLYLEVIDAVNATTATSATKNDVVLLQDCGFSTIEVSGGHTLHGNGFTMTCGSDSAVLDMGYSFVKLNNGTLDNIQIVCPNFDYAVLYKSNLTDSANRSLETDKVRYYNAMSGVMASGNSQILNSRISGARAAVNVSSGNLVIDNSRIEGGAVASILVGSANSLTLRDVTLVQKPTESTYKAEGAEKGTTLMGFSVLYMCDSEGKATPTTLEGTLVQQAWVNAEDKQYVPSAGQDIVEGVMKETAFIHNIDGKDSLNLGFAYMPEDAQKTVAAPNNITDNRTDKAAIPYEMKDVKIQIAILSTTVYVYSYKNTNGTDISFVNVPAYVPNANSDIITVTYSDTAEGLTTGKSYSTSGWVYELNVDLDKLSGYALDFSKLSMSVNGTTVTDFKVDGSAKPTTPAAVTAGGKIYTLTATVNGAEYTVAYKVTGTETSKESPSLVASNYEAGLCVASSYGGTWSGAAPALKGIQIKYWSVAEQQYKTINLSDYTPTTKGQLNGTNTTWTYSPDNDDFTLTLTGGQVHSSNSVNAMPVCVDTDDNGTADTLYFVAANSKGLVNSGNGARTVPVTYTFKDNNNGDVLTFSHTWSVAENKDDQYKYSDFCNGTKTKLQSSGGGSCITADTLITLADGTQKRVDQLKGDELLLVWNLNTGKYEAEPIVFVDSEEEAEYEIIHLYFSDGSDVKVIYEHGFFDLDLGKYVYIDASNYADYVGHRFVALDDIAANTWNVVTLDEVVIETEVTTAWSPVTFEHLCYYTNGVLSMPGGIEGLFNIFEVDTDTMTYDAEAMQEDIETHGLFTLEDFGGMIPKAAFEAFNGAYLKVALGKGLLTWEDIAYMAERYVPLM